MPNLLLAALGLIFFTSIALAGAPSSDTAADMLKNSPRHGEWVDIAGGETKIHSFVVYPERKEKAPVVIVIHEIFGMTDWVRSVADALAAEGFIAVAPDLLSGKGPGGGGTESFKADEVRDAIRKLTPEELTTKLNAIRDYALALPAASGKSATIGFCWGGGMSFAYATNQPKLNAAVVYYGSPPAKEAMAKIACPVAGFYGGDDARITATVEPTKKTMAELKKSYDPHVYEGAGHGFLRQQSGREANAKAAAQAWTSTIEFLKKNLE
jgi:carboxymethylenebutenolidase